MSGADRSNLLKFIALGDIDGAITTFDVMVSRVSGTSWRAGLSTLQDSVDEMVLTLRLNALVSRERRVAFEEETFDILEKRRWDLESLEISLKTSK